MTAGAHETLDLEVDAGVATITLNRPDRINAISPQLRDDLDAVLTELKPRASVRVVRIRGAGRGFCSGYDLASGSSVYNTIDLGGPVADPEPGSVPPTELPKSSLVQDRERLRESIERWLLLWSYPKPLVAQVHGVCLSGGLDLIGVCDIVYAARSASFGHPAARGLGIPPTMGMLPLRIGAAATKELFFTGDTVDGVEAKELGIVTRVFADDDLDAQVLMKCQRMAATPLDALTLHKGVVNRWAELMGARLGALAGADYDAMFHATAPSAEFGRIAGRDGIRAALAWRDQGFTDDTEDRS